MKKSGDCDWINRGVASSNGKLHHSSTIMWLNMGIIKQYTENISYSYIYIYIYTHHIHNLMIFPLKVYCQRISPLQVARQRRWEQSLEDFRSFASSLVISQPQNLGILRCINTYEYEYSIYIYIYIYTIDMGNICSIFLDLTSLYI